MWYVAVWNNIDTTICTVKPADDPLYKQFLASKFFVDNKFEEVSNRKTISTATGHCSGAAKKGYNLRQR